MLGTDKVYDSQDFVNELRSMKATPHMAQNANGRSFAIARTMRHAAAPLANGSEIESRKISAGSRPSPAKSKPNPRSLQCVGWVFTFAVAA